MCDYSLCGLPNRLAIEGEDLVVHKFRTGSMGLASAADLNPPEPRAPLTFWQRVKAFLEGGSDSWATMAVCIPSGAHLILKEIPGDLQQRWGLGEEEGAVFVQISADANAYRDALRFCNGSQLLLQSLREGMRVEVLSLGSTVADEDPELALRAR